MRTTPEGGSVPINSFSNRIAAGVNIGSLSFVDWASVVATFDGGRPVLLLVSFLLKNDTALMRTYTARITLDGSPVSANMETKIQKSNDAGERPPYSFHFFADAFPAGQHTVALQIKSDSEDAGQEVSECRLTAVEF